ncbi:MAG: hypothetical protein KGJ59_01470 [Bacteroidota bacterium]|nr:hypothetical protein [Bacteroidota bacterium]
MYKVAQPKHINFFVFKATRWKNEKKFILPCNYYLYYQRMHYATASSALLLEKGIIIFLQRGEKMSNQQLISTIEPLPIQDKLALIEFLSRSVQKELAGSETISQEAKHTLALLQDDPSWQFLKDAEEDIYSEADIKERR